MITIKCEKCGERYPGGLEHECPKDKLLKVGKTLTIRKPEKFTVTAQPDCETEFDATKDEIIKALAFWRKHRQQSRDGVKRWRAKKAACK